MRKIVCIMLLMLISFFPQYAAAQDIKFNIAIVRLDDGITSAEILYNDQVIWRLTLLSDGAKPVSSSNGVHTTVIVPDIIDGCFLLKVNSNH